jgi:hypothetical protein
MKSNKGSIRPDSLMCIWEPVSGCGTCQAAGKLMCHFDRKDMLHFFMIIFPYWVTTIGGTIRAGYGGYLWFWPLYGFFFFFIWEARVLCRHCPYWAVESPSRRVQVHLHLDNRDRDGAAGAGGIGYRRNVPGRQRDVDRGTAGKPGEPAAVISQVDRHPAGIIDSPFGGAAVRIIVSIPGGFAQPFLFLAVVIRSAAGENFPGLDCKFKAAVHMCNPLNMDLCLVSGQLEPAVERGPVFRLGP